MPEPVNPPRTFDPLRELLGLLVLEPAGRDIWHGGSCSRSLPFVFGGQVAAQSLAAAYETIPEPLRVHSLHACFLTRGDPDSPLVFSVQRVRDGRSFSVRRVDVSQANGVVFAATMSFHADEAGLQHSAKMVAVEDPAGVPGLDEWLGPHAHDLPRWWRGPLAIDLRYPEQPPHLPSAGRAPQLWQRVWLRAAGAMPDEPRCHDCVFTFASDLNLLDSVFLAHGKSWYGDAIRFASLDHVIWFHRPLSIDSWLLYDQRSPAAYGGLALGSGDVFSEDGTLVASVAQQGAVRLLSDDV